MDNQEVRIFDTKPYLEKGIFQELKDLDYFQQVKTFFGGVQWPNEQDFSPDTLYLESTILDRQENPSVPDKKWNCGVEGVYESIVLTKVTEDLHHVDRSD